MIQQLLDVYPQELKVGMWTGTLHTHVHSSGKGGRDPVPTDGWLDERTWCLQWNILPP